MYFGLVKLMVTRCLHDTIVYDLVIKPNKLILMKKMFVTGQMIRNSCEINVDIPVHCSAWKSLVSGNILFQSQIPLEYIL